ncbi:YIP1 family protein [Leptospira sp. WS92.C1]
MNIWNHIKNTLFNSKTHLSQNSDFPDYLNSNTPYKNYFILILICAILLIGTRVIRESSDNGITVKVPPGSEAKIEQNRREYSEQNTVTKILIAKLIYILAWIAIPLIIAGIRFGFLKILGDKNGNFSDLLKLTLSTTIPILLLTGFVSVTYDLLPIFPWNRNVNSFLIQVGVSFVSFLIGFLWEGRLCLYAFKNFYGQNSGRAVLTWLSPGMIFLNLLSLTIILRSWLS